MLVSVINSHGCILFIFVVILLTVSVSRVLMFLSCVLVVTVYLFHDYCRSIVCRVLINTSHVPLICSGGCFFLYKYPLL